MRLFVGLWLPDHVVDTLHDLDRPDRRGVRWTTEDQWHVTLRFLGSVDDADAVGEALSRAVAECPPVEATTGAETTALGRHLLAVPVEGVDELAGVVRDATADLGAEPDDRPFRGHVTVARCKQGDARRLAGAALDPVSWAVRDVALVRSRTLPEGARYETLATFPLAG